MVYDCSEFFGQIRNWLQHAITDGCLPALELQKLEAIADVRGKPLFTVEDQAFQPLLLAFIGGTGVGKSSLLNRLAGQAIAKAGVERPTSREVTLYHHHNLALQHLPSGAPLSSVRMATHGNDENRRVVWIDMPDFDSIDTANHRMVLDWLPYLDVLIYVVSPERYRDAKSWRLLQAEGAKHAWLFVMNHWDRGVQAQFDDFRKQLQAAGFDQPFAFKTSCASEEDEFAALLQHLQQLGGHQLSEQLHYLHRQQHAQNLVHALQGYRDQLQSQDYSGFMQFIRPRQSQDAGHLLEVLSLPIRQLAQAWAQNLALQHQIQLWDGLLQTRWEDYLDDYLANAEQFRLPISPLRAAWLELRQVAGPRLNTQSMQQGRAALLNPGNRLQRGLLVFLKILETLLPLSALAVVGYQVFVGYYQGATQQAAYLGSDFAVHSVLLIALSWLAPFFLHKKMQPSLERAALRGLTEGAERSMHAMMQELLAAVLQQQQLLQHRLEQLQQLQNQGERQLMQESVKPTEWLERVFQHG
jgi:50S ribosome-binding GTPase